MSVWRAAFSLTRLLAQVNAAHPDRSKVSDGVIGDAAHAASVSDHNPVDGVVHALDVTNDPAHGLDAVALANALVASHDPRISYVISNRRIASATVAPWTWRPYGGVDPHTSHVHVSVVAGPAADSVAAWALAPPIAPARPPLPPPAPPEDTVKPWFFRSKTGAIVIVTPTGVRAVTPSQWAVWTNLGYTLAPNVSAMDPGPFAAVLASLGGLK